MADKAKTQNSERSSRKAWGKNHNVVRVKPAPSAEKVARREARSLVSAGGSSVTMPKITWEWVAARMAMVNPRSTRRSNSVDAYFSWASFNPRSRKENEGVLLVSDNNLEVKTPRTRKPNKKNGR